MFDSAKLLVLGLVLVLLVLLLVRAACAWPTTQSSSPVPLFSLTPHVRQGAIFALARITDAVGSPFSLDRASELKHKKLSKLEEKTYTPDMLARFGPPDWLDRKVEHAKLRDHCFARRFCMQLAHTTRCYKFQAIAASVEIIFLSSF